MSVEPEVEESTEPAELFSRFGPVTVCNACGVTVGMEDRHKEFHADLREAFEDIVRSLNAIVDVLTSSRTIRKQGGDDD